MRTELKQFFLDLDAGETPAYSRDSLFTRNLGPGYAVAQEWAKESATISSHASAPEHLNNFNLPVGVRPSERSKISVSSQTSEPSAESDINNNTVAESVIKSSNSPWSALTDASFEAVKSFYNSASTIVEHKQSDPPVKQGGLSMRAASMLVFY